AAASWYSSSIRPPTGCSAPAVGATMPDNPAKAPTQTAVVRSRFPSPRDVRTDWSGTVVVCMTVSLTPPGRGRVDGRGWDDCTGAVMKADSALDDYPEYRDHCESRYTGRRIRSVETHRQWGLQGCGGRCRWPPASSRL